METDTDVLFRLLAKGIAHSSRDSLIGQTRLKIERLESDLDACARRATAYQQEWSDVSNRIEQSASLDLSDVENLFARQQVLEHRMSLNAKAQESALRQVNESKLRFGALRENYKQLLIRMRSTETEMRFFPTEDRYVERLKPILQEMKGLVGSEAAPTPQAYQPPPEFRWNFV